MLWIVLPCALAPVDVVAVASVNVRVAIEVVVVIDVDGVVAIFSAKHIIKQIDKDSIGFFKGLNGKFCGSVLNMVELENLNDA